MQSCPLVLPVSRSHWLGHLSVSGNAICEFLAECSGDNDWRVTTTVQPECNEQRGAHSCVNACVCVCVCYVYVTESSLRTMPLRLHCTISALALTGFSPIFSSDESTPKISKGGKVLLVISSKDNSMKSAVTFAEKSPRTQSRDPRYFCRDMGTTVWVKLVKWITEWC